MRFSRIGRFCAAMSLCALPLVWSSAQQPDLPPGELVRQAVNNEMSANAASNRHLCSKMRRERHTYLKPS